MYIHTYIHTNQPSQSRQHRSHGALEIASLADLPGEIGRGFNSFVQPLELAINNRCKDISCSYVLSGHCDFVCMVRCGHVVTTGDAPWSLPTGTLTRSVVVRSYFPY